METLISGKAAVATATIESGSANSSVVNVAAYRFARFFTGSTVGGLSSVTPKAVDSSGNLRNLVDSSGSAASAISIAANTYYTIPTEFIAAGHRLAFTGNTNASATVTLTIELVG